MVQRLRTFRRSLPLALLALLLASAPVLAQTFGRDIAGSEAALQNLQSELPQLAQSTYNADAAERRFAAIEAELQRLSFEQRQLADAAERRFAAIEAELQRLTDKIERLSFEQRQLADRMDRLQRDVEFRLSQLEGGSTGGDVFSGIAGSVPGSVPSAPSDAAGSIQIIGTVSAEDLQQTQSLVVLSPGQTAAVGQSGDSRSSGIDTGSVAAPAAASNLSAEQQYQAAFNLLRREQYADAEQALRDFVQANPGDPLVANAKYWLGETHYVRSDYQSASQAFAIAYRDHPNGPKAADSLLKLGLSLSLLGQTSQACQVLKELEARTAGQTRGNILERGRREQANLGCS